MSRSTLRASALALAALSAVSLAAFASGCGPHGGRRHTTSSGPASNGDPSAPGSNTPGSSLALAPAPPDLGTASAFAVLGGQTVTNTGPTVLNGGDLGVSPGTAVTGFPPGLLFGGVMHLGDAVALQAQADLVTAYDDLAGRAMTQELTGTDLGGLTLKQGVYRFTSSAQLTGTLTLDGEGAADPVFIFQIASTLTTASDAAVVVINSGDACGCGVYWQIGSSATIGTGTAFEGNLLALTSITLASGSSVMGRALARNGAVTMDANTIDFCDPNYQPLQ